LTVPFTFLWHNLPVCHIIPYFSTFFKWFEKIFILAMSLLMVDFLYFSNIDLSGRQTIYLVKISLFVVGEGLAPPEKSP